MKNYLTPGNMLVVGSTTYQIVQYYKPDSTAGTAEFSPFDQIDLVVPGTDPETGHKITLTRDMADHLIRNGTAIVYKPIDIDLVTIQVALGNLSEHKVGDMTLAGMRERLCEALNISYTTSNETIVAFVKDWIKKAERLEQIEIEGLKKHNEFRSEVVRVLGLPADATGAEIISGVRKTVAAVEARESANNRLRYEHKNLSEAFDELHDGLCSVLGIGRSSSIENILEDVKNLVDGSKKDYETLRGRIVNVLGFGDTYSDDDLVGAIGNANKHTSRLGNIRGTLRHLLGNYGFETSTSDEDKTIMDMIEALVTEGRASKRAQQELQKIRAFLQDILKNE